jgi:hypothetical protein
MGTVFFRPVCYKTQETAFKSVLQLAWPILSFCNFSIHWLKMQYGKKERDYLQWFRKPLPLTEYNMYKILGILKHFQVFASFMILDFGTYL